MKYKLLASKYHNGKKYFKPGDLVELKEHQYEAFKDMFEPHNPKANAEAEAKAKAKAAADAKAKADAEAKAKAEAAK